MFSRANHGFELLTAINHSLVQALPAFANISSSLDTTLIEAPSQWHDVQGLLPVCAKAMTPLTLLMPPHCQQQNNVCGWNEGCLSGVDD